MKDITQETMIEIERLTVEMKDKIKQSFDKDGIEALALIAGVLTLKDSHKYQDVLNKDKICLRDLVCEDSVCSINSIGESVFLSSLLDDKKFLQANFLANDPRYDDDFIVTAGISCNLSECTCLINPPIGTRRKKGQRMHFTNFEGSENLGDIEWAIQCVYLRSCGDNPRYCTKGDIPGMLYRGKVAYYSHYFHRENHWVESQLEKCVKADVDFISDARRRGALRKTSIIAFLPEQINWSQSSEELRRELVSGAFARSALTYRYESHRFTSWHMGKMLLQNLENRDRSALRISGFLGLLLSLVAAVFFCYGQIFFGTVFLLVGVVSLLFFWYLRRKIKDRRPHYIALCMVDGVPSEESLVKIRQKIIELEEESIDRNTEHLSRGDVPSSVKHGASELKNGHTVISPSCEASFYVSDVDVRPAFVAYVHQPDTEMRLLGDLITLESPSVYNPCVSQQLPVVGELEDNYFSCRVSGFCSYLSPCDDSFYVLNKDTIMFDFRRGLIGHVDTDKCLIAKDVYAGSIESFRISKDSIHDIRYLLKMLSSDFVKEQISQFAPTDIRLLEIPFPDKYIQDRELLLDQKEEFKKLVFRHKHEVGNELSKLNSAYELLMDTMSKNGGILRGEQIVNPISGASVHDLLDQMGCIQTTIGYMMKRFWIEEVKREAGNLKLKEYIEGFSKRRHGAYYKVDVDCSMIDNDVTVKFHTDDLNSILENIFINAERHGFKCKDRDDYMIRIVLEDTDDGCVLLKVANNGERLTNGFTVDSVMADGTGDGDTEHVGLGTIKTKCENNNASFKFEDVDSDDGFHIVYSIKLQRNDR